LGSPIGGNTCDEHLPDHLAAAEGARLTHFGAEQGLRRAALGPAGTHPFEALARGHALTSH
jgi:hypothetical protein